MVRLAQTALSYALPSRAYLACAQHARRARALPLRRKTAARVAAAAAKINNRVRGAAARSTPLLRSLSFTGINDARVILNNAVSRAIVAVATAHVTYAGALLLFASSTYP